MKIWQFLKRFFQWLFVVREVPSELALEASQPAETPVVEETTETQQEDDGIQWETFSTKHVQEFKRRGLASRPKQ